MERKPNINAHPLLWFAGYDQISTKRASLSLAILQSAIHMRDFSRRVRFANSKHALAIFNACFSETIFTSSHRRPPAALTQATTYTIGQLITYCDAAQLVSDNRTLQELFVRALNNKEPVDINSDRYLTAIELGLFLSDRESNLAEAQQLFRT